MLQNITQKLKEEIPEILRNIEYVSKNQKNIFKQLHEIIILRLKNKLGITEYYLHQLWNDQKFIPKEKLQYLGWRKELEIDRLGNAKEYFGIVDDKYIFSKYMHAIGINCPEIYAIYSDSSRFFAKTSVLSTKEELKKYLFNTINYPFFAKPLMTSRGEGAFGIKSISRGRNKFEFINNQQCSIDKIINKINAVKSGYIFQEYLQTTSKLKLLCGDKLTTLRVIILIRDGQANIFRIVWNVPIGANMISQYYKGNIAGKVNVKSGNVENLIIGKTLDKREIEYHPETKERLKGITIPYFRELKEILINGSLSLPGLKFQHWDVALTNKGPIILETNRYGGFTTVQAVGPPGLFDEELQKFVSSIR